MPPNAAHTLTLTDADRHRLEALARASSTPQALARRCRLVLRAAAPDRPTNGRIAAELRCDRHTVGLWRARFAEHGLAGLQDAPRPGRPARVSPPAARPRRGPRLRTA
jgi:FixJ family two-component response regulator